MHYFLTGSMTPHKTADTCDFAVPEMTINQMMNGYCLDFVL